MSGGAGFEIDGEAVFLIWGRARSIAGAVGGLLYPCVEGSAAVAVLLGGSVARQGVFTTPGVARCERIWESLWR